MATSTTVSESDETDQTDGRDESHREFVAPPAAARFGWVTDRRLKLLFILPSGLLLIGLFLFPLLWALVLSFTDFSATRNQPIRFVWFENYVEVLTSASVWNHAVTTGIIVGAAVALQTLLGFGIAYLISRQQRWRGVLMIVFLLPMILPRVIVGAFWRFMLDAQFGVINGVLQVLGFGTQQWLSEPTLATISLIVVDTWQWTPFIMVISLAGLTALPAYLYEAAEIDRASEWFKFRHITLPLVWPLLLIAILFRAIDAFRLFEIVFVVTGGGPGVTTETLSFQLYKVAFLRFDTGLASAYGILMALFVIVAGFFYVRYLRKVQDR